MMDRSGKVTKKIHYESVFDLTVLPCPHVTGHYLTMKEYHYPKLTKLRMKKHGRSKSI